ncbi:bacteriophage DNA transposition protein A [Campylobacter blaseri]|uniref:Integrase catalytic domain-containing protein n=1 Tax=Campylobacter blaseri TaxID=2042961 RepID=A0A2P8R2P3_9BACT|nr:DDE-type integrase/transposase/recombinase [Campylobacter blaseri]PSM52765.1 hypothetical protein CQ405_03310 [Campylobacter blaseri]PSM54413.1 hypothetical protein CRN67_03310 [Campylobacter blaseri]QKF86076.1 bacteriophage DNA transposition protein A [Campylobacter blaseri]
MYYLRTSEASLIFSVTQRTLQSAAQRNSTKYPFLKIEDAGVRARGGVKLLFEVSEERVKKAIDSGKIKSDVSVYIYENKELKELKFSEICQIKSWSYKGLKACNDKGLGNCSDETLGGRLGDVYLNSSDEEIKEAREKAELLQRFEIAKKSKVPCDKFCELEKISRSNLFRWQKAYKEKGIRGLIDKRGKKKGSYKLERWMEEFIINKFRAYGAGILNITQIWKDLHIEYSKKSGDFSKFEFLQGKVKPLFDIGVITRFIDNYYKNRQVEYMLVTKGFDRTVGSLEPAHGNQGILITRRNECWQIDSSPLDLIVRNGEGGQHLRPNILSIIDIYSGRCVATLAESSNALALTRLLYRAISELGLPEAIKGDNGRDYVSEEFQRLLEGIGVSYISSRAYQGRDKGFVERHFRTIQQSKMANLPGYIGRNVAMRENIEHQTPKKERHAKDEFGHTIKTHQELLLTYEEMKKIFEVAVYEWDMTAIKRGKIAPITKWNGDNTPLKHISYENFILYAGSKGLRKVTKKGIVIDGIRYSSNELPYGEEVRVSVNIDNVSEAFVFSMDGDFICKAVDSEIRALNAEDFSTITKRFNKNLRELRRAIKNAKLSEFSKLNIDYDLAETKKAHMEALKKEPRELINTNSTSAVFEKIKKQEEVAKIKKASFDYEKYEAPKIKKSKIKPVDELIEEMKAV